MDGTKIDISDILGSKRINIDTPLLVLSRVPGLFIVRCDNDSNVCDVDIEKIQGVLEKRIQFIDRFIPVGQIINDRSRKSRYYTIILANTRIIPVTNTYEKIKDNTWIGVIRRADKISRSLGVIYSKEQPTTYIPVFPASFLKKIDDGEQNTSVYSDLYTIKEYGRWMVYPYKLNVDKRQLKMIDSTGGISNMVIPDSVAYYVTPDDVVTTAYSDSGKKYNRKVYFTTQGMIASDSNCVPHEDNMNDMTMNECNATQGSIDFIATPTITGRKRPSESNIQAMDDGSLALNETPKYSSVFSLGKRSGLYKIGKNLILKEKDEPWFTNEDVVGSVANVSDPHKITGKLSTGTVYGDTDEIEAPFTSDCVIDLPIGYSRADADRKCRGEHFNNSESESNMDYVNNVIMYVMCVLIIILLLYRR